MTPLVRITLGAAWEDHETHAAGDVVEVDAVRGLALLAEVKGSSPADPKSAAALGLAEDDVQLGAPANQRARKGVK